MKKIFAFMVMTALLISARAQNTPISINGAGVVRVPSGGTVAFPPALTLSAYNFSVPGAFVTLPLAPNLTIIGGDLALTPQFYTYLTTLGGGGGGGGNLTGVFGSAGNVTATQTGSTVVLTLPNLVNFPGNATVVTGSKLVIGNVTLTSNAGPGNLTITGSNSGSGMIINQNVASAPGPHPGATTALYVNQSDSTNFGVVSAAYGASGGGFGGYRADGTGASPTPIQAEETIGDFYATSLNVTTNQWELNAADLQFKAYENWSTGHNGTWATLRLTNAGQPASALNGVVTWYPDGSENLIGTQVSASGWDTIGNANGVLVLNDTYPVATNVGDDLIIEAGGTYGNVSGNFTQFVAFSTNLGRYATMLKVDRQGNLTALGTGVFSGLYSNTTLQVTGAATFGANVTFANSGGNVDVDGQLNLVGSNPFSLGGAFSTTSTGTFGGILYANAGSAATSTTGGSLQVVGGAGVTGNVYAGQQVNAASGTEPQLSVHGWSSGGAGGNYGQIVLGATDHGFIDYNDNGSTVMTIGNAYSHSSAVLNIGFNATANNTANYTAASFTGNGTQTIYGNLTLSSDGTQPGFLSTNSHPAFDLTGNTGNLTVNIVGVGAQTFSNAAVTGLGNMSLQNNNAVNILGGTLSGTFSGTPVLSLGNGTTAVTQGTGDSTTKVATDSFVINASQNTSSFPGEANHFYTTSGNISLNPNADGTGPQIYVSTLNFSSNLTVLTENITMLAQPALVQFPPSVGPNGNTIWMISGNINASTNSTTVLVYNGTVGGKLLDTLTFLSGNSSRYMLTLTNNGTDWNLDFDSTKVVAPAGAAFNGGNISLALNITNTGNSTAAALGNGALSVAGGLSVVKTLNVGQNFSSDGGQIYSDGNGALTATNAISPFFIITSGELLDTSGTAPGGGSHSWNFGGYNGAGGVQILVDGSGYNLAATAVSDPRLKQNITPASTGMLALLAQVPGTRYQFNAAYQAAYPATANITYWGQLAPDVAAVFPDVTSTGNVSAPMMKLLNPGAGNTTGIVTIDYGEMVPKLWVGINELYTLTQAQQAEITALAAQITALSGNH